MEMGIGALRWSPDQFWNATPAELTAGIEGYNEAHGGKPKPKPEVDHASISKAQAWFAAAAAKDEEG